MRTATITFHSPNNNGSFLQAYSLQRILTVRYGVENEIIDFQTEQQIHQYSLFRPVRSPRDLVKNVISMLHFKKLKDRNERYEHMRQKYLRMTRRCSEVEEVADIANKYDLVIAGSDQIWNTEAPDFSKAFLLPGVKPRKAAYAVSFGSIAKGSFLAEYVDYLREFSSISVREYTAKKYLSQITGMDIRQTIDPTLLLDAEEYMPLMTSSKETEKEEYAFFYSIGYPAEAMETAKAIADKHGLKLITVFTSFHTVNCEKYGIKVRYSGGPADFLNLIWNSKMVLTDSFHGTVFSIIFHKPFFHLCKTLNGKKQRDDRIDGLLQQLDITGCNVSLRDIPDCVPELNWQMIDKRKGELRHQSYEYLDSVLSEKAGSL